MSRTKDTEPGVVKGNKETDIRVAWIDLETTGLWDSKHPPLILEIACCITDGGLSLLAEKSIYVGSPNGNVPAMSDVVLEMHRKNGLIEDWVSADKLTVTQADRELSSMIKEVCGKIRPLLGGNSPHALDRPMIRHYMPMTHASLSHRNFDATSLMYAGIVAGIESSSSSGSRNHRAMDDIRACIEDVRRHADTLKKGNSFNALDSFLGRQAKKLKSILGF